MCQALEFVGNEYGLRFAHKLLVVPNWHVGFGSYFHWLVISWCNGCMFYEHVMWQYILGKKTLIRFDLYIYTNLNVTWSYLETRRKGRNLRATSHTRLRACDHYISSTLIGGKCGAGPSSLYPTLGTNGVCECKMDVKSTWIPTWHQMDHVSWSLELF